MELERKITKIGKSYGVTIPLDMLKENGIVTGDMVQLNSKDGEISFHKSRKVHCLRVLVLIFLTC